MIICQHAAQLMDLPDVKPYLFRIQADHPVIWESMGDILRRDVVMDMVRKLHGFPGVKKLVWPPHVTIEWCHDIGPPHPFIVLRSWYGR